ncbi:spore germination protein [Cohnella sp. CFH 77786]|uniref:spore germination protein n=1 Tax=Cohnella sp. CFH 77786 TaxID=2662265 RepID=UPI001C60AF18|nr:spore germination protein [Cohnella sp. CFH 77786]MBW5446360.1 spore germination protein [Cohnella sp. CFH 77786]
MKRGVLKLLLKAGKRIRRSSHPTSEPSVAPRAQETGLDRRFEQISTALGASSDLVLKEIRLGGAAGPRVGAAYLDGLSDTRQLFQSLHGNDRPLEEWLNASPEAVLEELRRTVLAVGDIKVIDGIENAVPAVLAGETALFADGCAQALTLGTSGGEKRGVEEPNTQSVIRGPREGFTELLRTNTALVRRKIRDARLRIDGRQIGRVTKTDVAVMYLKGFASEAVVAEVHDRLDRIDTDAILESGYIEEFIQDHAFSPFPTIYNTERPDTVAAGLLEGRVAIFVNGTPFVLLVPALFTQYFQAPEDYYQRADFSSLLRILRLTSFFVALLAPSLYIAVTTFHQELLPTPLLIGLAGQREGVPFPAFIEALMMEITFEILREAGVRMPKAIGQSVSIVGTLVIGQAAVEAGLVSPAMVIVVSITAISNFVVPAFNMAISLRILRFLFMGVAASFGLFGVVVGLIGLVLHLCSLKSFGVSYMAPYAPLIRADQKDSLLRLPVWALRTRPRSIPNSNPVRQAPKGGNPS